MKKIILTYLLFLILQLPAYANTQKLTVILDWFPNPDHAPLIIAKQLGFFKAQGLEVELIGPADPTDPPKWAATDKADIAVTYQPEFMEQVDHGLPLISIGTLIDKPLNCLVSLDNNIKSLADLKGKRIGSTHGSLTSLMLKDMLAKEGLNENDVEIVNVRYNLTQALLSHRVDAVTGLMRNVEVPMLEQTQHQVTAFFPEEQGVPTYSELVFVTHIKHAQDQRFPRFLTAVKKAVRYLDEHPQLGWETFIKAYPEANNAVNHEEWFATIPYFAEEPASVNHQEWQRFAQFLQANKLIKTIQPVSRYTTA